MSDVTSLDAHTTTVGLVQAELRRQDPAMSAEETNVAVLISEALEDRDRMYKEGRDMEAIKNYINTLCVF